MFFTPFLHFLLGYKYTLIFLALFWGGDTALLLGIYFSVIGVMSFWYVISLALFASLLADAVWYWVGMLLSYDHLKRLPYFRSHKHKINGLEKFLDRHALKTLFYSKFVYGTRMIVQIICGTHGVNLAKYFLINTLGTVIWIGIFVLIGKTLSANLHTFKHVAHGIELAFLLLIAIIITIHVVAQKVLARQMKNEK